MFKKLIAMICCVALCFTSVSPALAYEGSGVQTGTVQSEAHLNPLHENSDAKASWSMGVSPRLYGSASNADYKSTVKEAAEILRKQMVQRKTEPVVYFRVDGSNPDISGYMDKIFLKACEHTGKSTEGDALKWDWKAWNCNASYRVSSSTYYITFTYHIVYYTSSDQEEELVAAIETVKKELDIDDKTEYQKIKAIYDYICDHVSYDEENLHNDAYTLKHTAYAALIHKKSVCQGYSILFYRLALEYGIDARVISGYAGEPHGWNIVKLDGKYYYLDATWDSHRTPYEYFLKGTKDFLKDHEPDAEFLAAKFADLYPVAASSYVVSDHTHKYESRIMAEPVCNKKGVKRYACTICTYYYDEPIPVTDHKWETSYTVDKKATYAAAGSKSIHCSVCDRSKSGTSVTIAKKKCTLSGPKTVTTRLSSANSIKVSWNKVSGAKGYYVRYKKSTASSWIWAKPVTGTTKTLSGLASGAKYQIRVYPYVTENGLKYKSSKYKTGSSVYTLTKVKKPTVKRVSSKKVSVKWTNINGESGYQVSLSSSKNTKKVFKTYKTKSGKTISKTLTVQKGKGKYYRVRAYKNVKINGETVKIVGPWSAPVYLK